MFSPPQILKLEGQEFIFNAESGVAVLEITQPFMKAGKILDWNDSLGVPGLGINKAICKFVEQKKIKLLVRVLSNPGNKEYWINYDKLRSCIKTVNTEYSVSGKFIHVIPWRLFSSKPNFSGGYS